jgi:hypothetical protein
MKRPAYAAWWWAAFVLATIALLGLWLPGSAWVATPVSRNVMDAEAETERRPE